MKKLLFNCWQWFLSIVLIQTNWITKHKKPFILVCGITLLMLLGVHHINSMEISKDDYVYLTYKKRYYSQCCPEYAAQLVEFMSDRKITLREWKRLKDLEKDIDLYLTKTKLL